MHGPDDLRVAPWFNISQAEKTERNIMRESNGMTVIVCENLGRPALLVKTSDKPLLLLDDGLTCEERIEIMSRFVDPDAA